MARLRERVPRYSKNGASGQAVVTLSGRDYYLGPHGTKTSHREYDRLIAEWLANGRRPLPTAHDDGFTVVELIAAYKRFACGYYRQHGKVSSEVAVILSACRPLRELYGREPVSEFEPLKLQAVRQAMIAAEWSRRVEPPSGAAEWSRRNINKQIGRTRRANDFIHQAVHVRFDFDLIDVQRCDLLRLFSYRRQVGSHHAWSRRVEVRDELSEQVVHLSSLDDVAAVVTQRHRELPWCWSIPR